VGALRVRSALPALVAAALALGACTANEDRQAAICPRAGILPDANTVVLFRDGPGRDLTDVIAQAQIVDVAVGCVYTSGRRPPGVTLDLQIAIAAERGPADRARRAALPYFVAILDGDQNIVAKEYFEARFEFPDNRTRVGRVDELEPVIPLRSNFDGPSYRVMVGFQLNADQLAWNRRQRGER
jgi:hypothetical protein